MNEMPFATRLRLSNPVKETKASMETVCQRLFGLFLCFVHHSPLWVKVSTPENPELLRALCFKLGVGHDTAKLGSCVKVEVAVLGSPSLIVLRVSVDVKQH